MRKNFLTPSQLVFYNNGWAPRRHSLPALRRYPIPQRIAPGSLCPKALRPSSPSSPCLPDTAATSPRRSNIAPSGAASPPSRSSSAPPPCRSFSRTSSAASCGLSRCERMLLRRAARGRDLMPLARRRRARPAEEPAAPPAEPAPADATAPPPAEVPPAATTSGAPGPWQRPGRAAHARDPAQHGATRCRGAPPPGRPEHRRDLPRFRHLAQPVRGSFWNRVFMAIHNYRGNLSNVVLEMQRREKQFDKEHWKHPDLPLPEQTRDGIRRVLGFRIGETPVDPFRPVPAPDAPPSPPRLACPSPRQRPGRPERRPHTVRV